MTLTLREFKERYSAGAFNDPDLRNMAAAGWTEYDCPAKELPDRMKRIWALLDWITSDAILDNFRAYFFCYRIDDGILNDVICMVHTDKTKMGCLDFAVSINDDDGSAKYTVYTVADHFKKGIAFDNATEASGFLNGWKLIEDAERANRAASELDAAGITVGTKVTIDGKTKTFIAVNMVDGTPRYVFDDDGYTIGQIRSAVHSSTCRGGDFNIQAPEVDDTEAVEMCPYCVAENVYRNWDVEKQGYVATCHTCGKKIFLCDECKHADDNPTGRCDWHGEERDGKEYGSCFRGDNRKPFGRPA